MPETVEDPLPALNAAFRRLYAEARLRELSTQGPIIVVIGDDLILVRGPRRDRVRAVPSAFHDLKAVAHLPLAIHVSLGDAVGPLAPTTAAGLRELKGLARAVRAAVRRGRFSDGQRDRQLDVLGRCDAFVTDVLRDGATDPARTEAFARALAPLVLANVADAARVQIEAYDAVVAAWRRSIAPEDWLRAKAVVCGSQLPRRGALPVQYFAKLFGEQGEGRRVIYAESIWEEEKALRLLGTHELDRRASMAFFEDPDRMHRDILADAAAAILTER